MGRLPRAHESEVPHARRTVPQVVTTIESHYAVTESTFGIGPAMGSGRSRSSLLECLAIGGVRDVVVYTGRVTNLRCEDAIERSCIANDRSRAMTGRRPTAMRVGPIITVTDLDLSREFTMASSAWKGHRRGVVGGWVGWFFLRIRATPCTCCQTFPTHGRPTGRSKVPCRRCGRCRRHPAQPRWGRRERPHRGIRGRGVDRRRLSRGPLALLGGRCLSRRAHRTVHDCGLAPT